MTIIDCSGDGRARGRAHGENARELIRLALSKWEEATLSSQKGETKILDYVRRFLGSTGLIQALERLTPDLIEEIRGIAEGSGQAFELIAAYNLMDEQWWYDLGAGPVEPGCSLIGVSDGSETVLSQNMDLPGFMDGTQIVLRLKQPDGLAMLVLSSAGLIGLTGVNSRGVAICVNALLMLRSNPNGLPVAAVLRPALAQGSVAEARTLLEKIPHASGQHYAIADRHGMVGIECSAGGAAESSPWGTPSLVHTNHPLASTDINERALAKLQERGRVANSEERLAFLDGWRKAGPRGDDVLPLLQDPTTPICVVALSDHPSQTFGSVVFRLSDSIGASFCLGNPATEPWREIPFA